MIKSLFTPWQDKSIEPVAGLITEPGLYFVNARAHGLKGLIGGTHSWIVGKLSDGSELVAEVTDIETLQYQAAAILFDPNDLNSKPITERGAVISNRNAAQRWFDSPPTVQAYFKMNDSSICSLLYTAVDKYPLNNSAFNIVYRNCNTFTSWVAYLSGFDVKPGIGGRSIKYWIQKG